MDGSIKNSPNQQKKTVVSHRSVLRPEHPNFLNEATPWDLDFRQIGKGQLRTETTVHAQSDCILAHIRMNRLVHQTGQPPAGYLAFGIPETEGIDKWHAQELSGDPLLSFGATSGFDSYTNQRHVGTTIAIPEDAFFSFACSVGLEVPDRVSESSVFDPAGDTGRLNILKQRLHNLLSSETVVWTKTLTDDITHDVLSVVCEKPTDYDERSPRNQRVVLDRTIELMLRHQEDVVPVSELCRKVGASWRTINRAFLDEFSVGPKAYYNRLRLNRVRNHLLNSRGRTSVSDAANRFDFWHMGQFAKDYRALFGELPSATLRRVKSQPRPGWR